MVVDELILGFDKALRTLTGQAQSNRPNPAQAGEAPLSAAEQRHAAGLMRINHTGEVCAQALYDGQALFARDAEVRAKLEHAAQEEQDHLAWCAERLTELDAQPSVLNPVFYGASFAVGAAAALLGDRVSLGFVEATEDQVCRHLDEHLERLPIADQRSRDVLKEMRADEERHGAEALAAGGDEFPQGVKRAMRLLARVMTETTYRV
ncbi:MAG: 2-polyprenyl-3-methyl-6-methoxy-1,4-benzoquinone monooxygenase [Pseudomonadota bacterium]